MGTSWRAHGVCALAALSLSACGAAGRPASVGAPRAASPPARSLLAAGDIRRAQALFGTACSVCHTLGGPSQVRTSGGELSGYRMTPAQVAAFIAVMPVRPRLDASATRLLAAYVAARQRQAQTQSMAIRSTSQAPP
jgi:mono/diheme cytochrome c family protein